MSVFVIALDAEARPLIDALKLKRLIDRPWPYYSNGDDHLLLTGIGQLNAAAACGWLIGHSPELARTPWLNVGIAGHAELAVGTLCWVERIKYKHGDLYPALHIRSSLPGSLLNTVDAPSNKYVDGQLTDMEGAAFYLICSRFVPIELLHLLKVVSDNRADDIKNINKAMVTELIKDNCTEILRFALNLSQLSLALPEAIPADLDQCVETYTQKWRFSHSQKQQLMKLLQRYHALTHSMFFEPELSVPARDAKQVLALLDKKIEHLPVTMP